MRNKMLLIVVICCVIVACAKQGPGYYSGGSGSQATPLMAANNALTRYYYFNNIIIDSNIYDTFSLPHLSQAIIDSGTVTVTFRSSIVWLDNWDPLPTYTFPDGSVVSVYTVRLQPGMAILRVGGPTSPAMNYCFALSTH